MKMAKKVLSVLLAIAMVLGTFAVAASANGNPATASHQVKYWLTASPIDSGATWTSNTRYVDGKYTDTQTGDMEVEPGQKVMISLHMTTNYYIGNVEGLIYFDSRLLTPGEIYDAERNALKRGTDARIKKMILFNEMNADRDGHPFFNTDEDLGDIYNSSNYNQVSESAVMSEAAIPNFYNCCVNDDGSYEFGNLADFAAVQNCGWDEVYYAFAPDPANEITMIMEDEEHCVLYFPVQVPADAQPGDTYKFKMPESNIRRNENKKGRFYVAECPDGVATPANLGNASYIFFSEDQYFDLSGTNITLTVKGAEAEVDYSKLQAKYDEVKDTVVANYNNTADFVTALAEAKTILDDKTADQATTDAALAALEAGYDKLEIKGADYTALNAAKSAAAAIKAENYEQDANWTAFQNAYTAAQNIAAGLDITHQAEISAAATALTNAIANLTPKAVEADADYSVLNAEIAASQKIVDEQQASWYTADTWSAFTTALAEAKAVPSGLKESQQATIDTAASALTAARTGLIEAAADYTALDALILECNALNSSDYTSASWSNLSAALSAANAVARDIKAKNQATIDTAYNNLKAAKDALVTLGKADYSELIAEIAKGTTYAQDYYTAESWAAYQTVLAAAQAMVNEGTLKEDEQFQITKMVEDLIAAKAALIIVDADYTAVETALAKIPADADLAAYYTTASAEAVIAAKNAVVRGLKKNRQADVDKMASDIESAVAALVLVPADTTALKAAIDEASSKVADLYTADSYAAMKTELDAANALYNTANLSKKDDQSRVDAQTAALKAAIGKLVPAGADYTALIAAVDEYEDFVNSGEDEYYTSESKKPYAAAYLAGCDVIDAKYSKAEQDKVDAAVKAINDAKAALVPALADFTELDTAITDINFYLTNYARYLTESYKTTASAAVESAKTTDFRATTKRNQSVVDAKRDEIVALYNAPEFLAWDYTKINEAKAAYAAIDRSLYTDESLATVDALFAEVGDNWVQDPRKPEGAAQSTYAAQMLIQSRVLKWESSLVLKPVEAKADYTDLDSAIATAEALIAKGTGNYTDDSVQVLKDALAAGKALSRDLLASEQATVDAATAAINAAMPLTEKDASYTALDAAIALAKTKNADDYTAASYEAMAAKLAAAEAVARNLKISAQATIDKAANELNAAISALVLKPVDVKGAVQSVDWTPSTDSFNTFNVKVNHIDGDYAYKIQFIDADGNTRTIARRNKAGIVTAATIKTFDAQGNECSELSADAAYDIWTIGMRIATGCEIKVIAKFGNSWESKELAYKFTVNLLEPTLDTTVYSITPAATAGKVGRIGVVVETGMDIQGVRTVMSTGATLTQKAYTVENGHKVFNAQASCYIVGENVIKVQVKYGNVWHDADSFTYAATK